MKKLITTMSHYNWPVICTFILADSILSFGLVSTCLFVRHLLGAPFVWHTALLDTILLTGGFVLSIVCLVFSTGKER